MEDAMSEITLRNISDHENQCSGGIIRIRPSVHPSVRPSVHCAAVSRMRMLNYREIQISFQCQCQIHSAREVAARFDECGLTYTSKFRIARVAREQIHST